MGQCSFIKSDGGQCKGRAVDGADLCAVHLKKALATEVTPQPEAGAEPVAPVEQVAPEKPAEPKQGGAVPAKIHNDLKSKRIRFIGRGRYAIPSENIVFERTGQVEEVSHKCWERLLTQSESREVFEEV